MKRRPNKPVLVAVVAGEVVSAVLAWRDLSRRSQSQLRGNKTAWRISIAVNPGNSLAYWAFGRR
jgi:hypothetical protein